MAQLAKKQRLSGHEQHHRGRVSDIKMRINGLYNFEPAASEMPEPYSPVRIPFHLHDITLRQPSGLDDARRNEYGVLFLCKPPFSQIVVPTFESGETSSGGKPCV